MSQLPSPAAPSTATIDLTRQQRDFLRLNIFVLARHGYFNRARALAEAMRLAGDDSADVALACAVLRFEVKDWRAALEALERLDRLNPVERFGDYRQTSEQRMRRYLRLRCLRELGEEGRLRGALDSYLRHGETGTESPE